MKRIVFSDFDGTLTDGTNLCPIFFDIVDFLDSKDIPLIIVTGRSVSWAHFLLVHFPSLNYIIAEGGGVICKRISGEDFEHHFLPSGNDLEELKLAQIDVLKTFEGMKLTSDSIGRISDRAIDLEIFKSIKASKLDVEKFFDNKNISHSTSSVHLNFWCGKISKYQAVKELLLKDFPEVEEKNCFYFGDSLNDQSMFKSFDNSIGVSNISKVLDQLEFSPKIILEGKENRGPYGVFKFLESNL